MSMFSIFNISGSAISAQAQRLNVVASNMANVEAVAGPNGQAYKARLVTFQTVPMGEEGASGVRINSVTESDAPMKKNNCLPVFGSVRISTSPSFNSSLTSAS